MGRIGRVLLAVAALTAVVGGIGAGPSPATKVVLDFFDVHRR
jgi:hypothetical protein